MGLIKFSLLKQLPPLLYNTEDILQQLQNQKANSGRHSTKQRLQELNARILRCTNLTVSEGNVIYLYKYPRMLCARAKIKFIPSLTKISTSPLPKHLGALPNILFNKSEVTVTSFRAN